MASTLVVLLLLSAGLFMVKAGIADVVSAISEDCTSYYTINRKYKEGFKCFLQHCCGNCYDKYCCTDERLKLTESVQSLCDIGNSDPVIIVVAVLGVIFNIAIIAICCCCPCCCIYKLCRRRRPVAGVQVTAVTNTNVVQQQSAVQGVQYPQYQPVPTQPGYSQPMQMTPYQAQPCAPGAPPSYHTAANPGYPTNQRAYNEDQAMYPTQTPALPGPDYKPPETPNTGY